MKKFLIVSVMIASLLVVGVQVKDARVLASDTLISDNEIVKPMDDPGTPGI